MSASARKNSATCGGNKSGFPNDDVHSEGGTSLRHAFASGNEETTLFDDSDDESADDVSSEFPILASEHLQNQYSLIEYGWTPTLKEILNATRSPVGSSAFSLLRNHEDTLIRRIYEYLTFPKVAKHVKWTLPGDKITHGQVLYEELPAYLLHDTAPVVNGQTTTWDLENIRQRQSLLQDLPEVSNGYTDGYVAHVSLGHVTFPEPTGRNVNMMPFTLGDIDSLPDDLHCYYPSLIQQCPNVKRSGVAYLTVEEGFVKADKTQRRPGLHIEAPGIGVLGYDGGDHEAMCRPGRERFWGVGYYVSPDQYLGGIYIASNMASTCQVFDALVDKSVPGTADRHGGCEHLRSVIGDGKMLEANELVWMTDQTPHEALPQKESGYRQFFRLVMPGISHWYAKHSTPNPKVPIPDDIVIVEESKFVDNSS